jgi:hypothetical protein
MAQPRKNRGMTRGVGEFIDSAAKTAIVARIILIKLIIAEPFDLSCMCCMAKLEELLKIREVPKYRKGTGKNKVQTFSFPIPKKNSITAMAEIEITPPN